MSAVRNTIQSMTFGISWLVCPFLLKRAQLEPLAVCALAALAAAQQPSAPPAPQASLDSVTIQDVLYRSINGSDLHLDVYQPADKVAETRPAVILIHGGGWSSLDKSTMRTMGQLLARSGFVAFSVDYRLFQNNENRWPAQLDDVQCAVRWVRANATKYGVDPQRIGAFGHSAGAQLAALLGMEETRDKSGSAFANYSSKVQAVVDVSGPSDFTADNYGKDSGFLIAFLGTHYDAHPDIWREASPVFHISKTDAPFLIVHGTQDESVPLSQAEELFSKLQSAGVPVSLIKVDDVHTFQTPAARRQLAIETLGFFRRYLKAT